MMDVSIITRKMDSYTALKSVTLETEVLLTVGIGVPLLKSALVSLYHSVVL